MSSFLPLDVGVCFLLHLFDPTFDAPLFIAPLCSPRTLLLDLDLGETSPHRQDTEETGSIELTKESFVKREEKKKKYAFAIGTTKRVFYMYPDTQSDQEGWMKTLSAVIDRLKSPPQIQNSNPTPTPTPTPTTPVQQPIPEPEPKPEPIYEPEPDDVPAGGFQSQGGMVRNRLDEAKMAVSFLQSEESKVLEFWQIWSESIPPQEDVVDGAIVFQVATAADMDKLTWRTSGPQNIFIQKMVDFFWNVGAPETEIDRLNDVGALINPIQIGSWIDMSGKGGMDGGWFFPVDVPIKFALESSDSGEPIAKVAAWAEANGVTRCTSVGRDMGAAPPRQTEIRFLVPGESFEEQLERGLSAFQDFDFPPIPGIFSPSCSLPLPSHTVDDMLSLIRSSPEPGLAMSVITSSEGFVRLGLMCPRPERALVEQLCQITAPGGSAAQILDFQNLLGVEGPAYAEYQYLMNGFGYGVYKEGFDVVFHYDVLLIPFSVDS